MPISSHARARRALPPPLTVGKLGRTSIRYDYQVFDEGEELAIEGTMTVVVLRDGKPTEIPIDLRAALGGETSEIHDV